MFSITSTQAMPILATYNPNGIIAIKASAIGEDLGQQFRTHVVEQKDPRFVYAIARAVTADVPNKNKDMFPLDEIKRAYTTFIGRNIFLDHNTKSVRNAVGKIIAAELREDEEGHTYVACLFKVDRELHPDIARKIENGIIDSVSMGANVGTSECSKCGHRASREADFCLLPGTLVATRGFVYKPIEDIQVGEYVVTHTGEEHLVTETFVREVDEDVYTIKSAFNNRTITATGNHPFGVATPTGYTWKAAKDLQVQDWLYQPNYKPEPVNDTNGTVEFAEWLGYYLSEGWTNAHGQGGRRPFNALEFSIGIYEDTFLKRLLELGEKFTGAKGRVYPSYRNSLGCSVRFTGDNIGKLLFEYGGHLAKYKELNPKVFSWSDAAKRALLLGFLEGDGTVARQGRAVSFSTSSMRLAFQLKRLFNDLGFPANVCSYVNGGGGPTNRSKTNIGYRVSMYGDNSEAFLKGEPSPLKFTHYNTPGFSFVWLNNYYFAVRDIEVSHYAGKVYNLSVEKDNSYIAEGVAVHNCDHQKNPMMYYDYYSINHGVEFTELSLVSVPADPEAKMHKVFNLQNGMQKVAIDTQEVDIGGQKVDIGVKKVAIGAADIDDISGGDTGEKTVQPYERTEYTPVNGGEVPARDTFVVEEKKPEQAPQKMYQIDCSSDDTGELMYNILYPYLNKGIEEITISGKGVKVLFNEDILDPEKFIGEAAALFGFMLNKGMADERTASLYNTYLKKQADLDVEAKMGAAKNIEFTLDDGTKVPGAVIVYDGAGKKKVRVRLNNLTDGAALNKAVQAMSSVPGVVKATPVNSAKYPSDITLELENPNAFIKGTRFDESSPEFTPFVNSIQSSLDGLKLSKQDFTAPKTEEAPAPKESGAPSAEEEPAKIPYSQLPKLQRYNLRDKILAVVENKANPGFLNAVHLHKNYKRAGEKLAQIVSQFMDSAADKTAVIKDLQELNPERYNKDVVASAISKINSQSSDDQKEVPAQKDEHVKPAQEEKPVEKPAPAAEQPKPEAEPAVEEPVKPAEEVKQEEPTAAEPQQDSYAETVTKEHDNLILTHVRKYIEEHGANPETVNAIRVGDTGDPIIDKNPDKRAKLEAIFEVYYKDAKVKWLNSLDQRERAAVDRITDVLERDGYNAETVDKLTRMYPAKLTRPLFKVYKEKAEFIEQPEATTTTTKEEPKPAKKPETPAGATDTPEQGEKPQEGAKTDDSEASKTQDAGKTEDKSQDASKQQQQEKNKEEAQKVEEDAQKTADAFDKLRDITITNPSGEFKVTDLKINKVDPQALLDKIKEYNAEGKTYSDKVIKNLKTYQKNSLAFFKLESDVAGSTLSVHLEETSGNGKLDVSIEKLGANSYQAEAKLNLNGTTSAASTQGATPGTALDSATKACYEAHAHKTEEKGANKTKTKTPEQDAPKPEEQPTTEQPKQEEQQSANKAADSEEPVRNPYDPFR